MRNGPTFANDEERGRWIITRTRSLLTQAETLEATVAAYAIGATSEEEREAAEDMLAHVQALTDALIAQLRSATEMVV